MIRGTFTRDEAGRIHSFELIGHAESGPYGSDIVCAAVSALAISTVNGIEALSGMNPIVSINEEDGGYLSCTLPDLVTQEQCNIAQILLENLFIGLTNMMDEYHDYLTLQTTHQ